MSIELPDMSRTALFKAAAALLHGVRMTRASGCGCREMFGMQLRRCTNRDCRRPYRISQCAGQTAQQSAGKLHCPHCGHVEALWEEERFSIHPLTDEQEALFEMR